MEIPSSNLTKAKVGHPQSKSLKHPSGGRVPSNLGHSSLHPHWGRPLHISMIQALSKFYLKRSYKLGQDRNNSFLHLQVSVRYQDKYRGVKLNTSPSQVLSFKQQPSTRAYSIHSWYLGDNHCTHNHTIIMHIIAFSLSFHLHD